MARQFEQVKKMREKAARLMEKARSAADPRMADKYLRQADNVLVSIKAIEDNWKSFGDRSRGNTNRRGIPHTPEARAKMSRLRKAFWKSKAGFERMWRARRRRQFREKGKCLLRFPRLDVSSAGQGWLKGYRKRYQRITGKRLGRSAIVYYPDKPERWAANYSTIS